MGALGAGRRGQWDWWCAFQGGGAGLEAERAWRRSGPAFWLLMVMLLSAAVLSTAVLMVSAAQRRRADETESAAAAERR